MPTQVNFTATGFSTLDKSSGLENLPPRANRPAIARVSVAENVRFTSEGGIQNRLGYEEKADLATAAKVDTLKAHEEYAVLFAKSSTTIKQSLDGATWYDIGVTRTAGEREFLFPNGKDMYATNQTDSFLRIAISTANGAIGTSDTTITVRTGDIGQFTAGGGTVYIEGDAIAYTGVSGNNLTGVTGIASEHANGAIITQTSTPSNAPKGNCMTELEGAAVVGGVSANQNRISVSLPSTSDNPEYFYDFSTANGATEKEMSSEVTALKTGLGVMLIGMKRGIDFSNGFEPASGALLTHPLSRTHSIPNAFCITEMDQEFAVLTSEGRILPVQEIDGTFRIIDDPNNPEKNLDFPISQHIQDNKDQSDNSVNFIHYDPIARELMVSILMTDSTTQELVYQRDVGAWSIDTSKDHGTKAMFKGRTYAGSDGDDKIYLDNEGRTDNTIPIESRIVTGLLTVDQKRLTNDFLGLKFGGLLSEAGEFVFRILVGGDTVQATISGDDLVDNNLMSISGGVLIGGGLIGAEQIGAGGSFTEAYRFTLPYEFMLEGDAIQLEWQITDEGTAFELRDFQILGESEGELTLTHL